MSKPGCLIFIGPRGRALHLGVASGKQDKSTANMSATSTIVGDGNDAVGNVNDKEGTML